jgi:hypothetical protein
MSWTTFLTILRHWLHPYPVRRRKSAKRPPDRRKRFFDLDGLEDRAFMEPPISMLAGAAVGIGASVYAVNVALANAPARAESYHAAAPVVPEAAPAEIPAATPFQGTEASPSAVVLRDYAGSVALLAGEGPGGFVRVAWLPM